MIYKYKYYLNFIQDTNKKIFFWLGTVDKVRTKILLLSGDIFIPELVS